MKFENHFQISTTAGTTPFPKEKVKLLYPPKLFLQLTKIHLNNRGPAVRTGVRHGTMTQVFNQVLQFPASKRVVRFDRMTANGFGNGMFAQPR
jgi:hypothetical protein